MEYTAGTTGISLAFVCAALGYRLHVVFSDAFSDEKRRTMLALGAEITDEPSDDGRITADLIRRMIARAGEISEQPGHWWSDQLNNHDAVLGYAPLGEEIWEQTDGRVDAFVHTVGTAHSIHGATEVASPSPPRDPRGRGRARRVGRPLRRTDRGAPDRGHRDRLRATAVGARTRSTRSTRSPSADGPGMARRLAREEGLFAGTSTGANVVAALRVAERLGRALAPWSPSPSTPACAT